MEGFTVSANHEEIINPVAEYLKRQSTIHETVMGITSQLKKISTVQETAREIVSQFERNTAVQEAILGTVSQLERVSVMQETLMASQLERISAVQEVMMGFSKQAKQISAMYAAKNPALDVINLLSQSNLSRVVENFSMINLAASASLNINTTQVAKALNSIVTLENLTNFHEYLKRNEFEFREDESSITIQFEVTAKDSTNKEDKSIKSYLLTFLSGAFADNIVSFTSETLNKLADILLLVIFTVMLNGNSTELINKIQGEISEHSTVQEIKRIYVSASPSYLLYDVGIIRSEAYLRDGRSRLARPVQKEKFEVNTIVEVLERKNNWIKVQVSKENGCITGWIEESKIMKLKKLN